MIRTILRIDGMACPMCEAHVNDVIRDRFPVRAVSSSRRKGVTEILSDQPLDERFLRETVASIGYTPISLIVEPYEKKRRF